MGRVLAISSHVARGHVGLAATVPALQWLGHEVWALPTVLLASRPGLGRFVRHDVPGPSLQAMLLALEADGNWASLDAVFTGYFGSAAAVAVAADAIGRIRHANAKSMVLVDPIIGDAGRLYVPGETAAAIRDRLLPLADVATPNLFELQWLTGATSGNLDDVARLAGELGPPRVVVTSAAEAHGEITTVLLDRAAVIDRSLTWQKGVPNGAGDLFAGLLLGHLLNGLATGAAFEASLTALDRVLKASSGRDVLQLAALQEQRP
jgi:pyridoxine kinase